jgi:hypothetical protein
MEEAQIVILPCAVAADVSVSIRQLLASDHAYCVAVARTGSRAWYPGHRYRPSCLRGTVKPVVVLSVIVHLLYLIMREPYTRYESIAALFS